MTKGVRVLLAFVTMVAVYYFVYWVGGGLLTGLYGFPLLVASITAGLAALAAGWFVGTRRSPPPGLLTSIMNGALVLGAIGFVGGFFGPMIFAPGANQGPMLGIFLTGPLGFLLGAVAGGIYWLVRRKKAPSNAGQPI